MEFADSSNEAVAINTSNSSNSVGISVGISAGISAGASDGQSSIGATTADTTSADYYFDSYSHFGIHEEMLKDEVRTKSYMNAIEQNKHLFKDKIVLDVGCGTGILSMFAARAGAKKVFAVECSNIADQCRQIVADNRLDHIVEVIKGKMEEIVLPTDYVDIIISEWMGYFLLYESMLDTVLWARDRYLRPETGILLPDKAVLYVCAIEDGDYRTDKIDFWDNVYGFNMSVIKNIALTEPLVDTVEPRSVLTNARPILNLDISTCTKEDLAFVSEFSLKVTRNDFCHALVAYFECAFTQVHKPIVFSTAPQAKYTHWKQTVFYLPETLTVCAGETIQGTLSCHPNTRNPRDLDISIAASFTGRHSQYQGTANYRLR